ncbi:hypothetical protein WN55_07803 [Dufourea novaeangliae]|uniref:Uncharacterized protein n=1 Tax=Dufourea novaeangliae TaxID=178035 RepID=A0A154PSQ5_DUFNO|nr:hypothetical protein WN55_07803 [Dufourea novaeangliae]
MIYSRGCTGTSSGKAKVFRVPMHVRGPRGLSDGVCKGVFWDGDQVACTTRGGESIPVHGGQTFYGTLRHLVKIGYSTETFPG